MEVSLPLCVLPGGQYYYSQHVFRPFLTKLVGDTKNPPALHSIRLETLCSDSFSIVDDVKCCENSHLFIDGLLRHNRFFDVAPCFTQIAPQTPVPPPGHIGVILPEDDLTFQGIF
ncbi:hypothetical protein GWK47_049048 [Chionoecetes opilio]|uniref:Uncharacterized protein n=1 Tax=Chionoecetes opilio TaxID=41210 RepID=A0A8J5CTG9_CHIOP|nr:hypothetical protein GWK47_049048 [Chionoecetes opilio]